MGSFKRIVQVNSFTRLPHTKMARAVAGGSNVVANVVGLPQTTTHCCRTRVLVLLVYILSVSASPTDLGSEGETMAGKSALEDLAINLSSDNGHASSEIRDAQSHLRNLPSEILANIFAYLEERDLHSFQLTCLAFHGIAQSCLARLHYLTLRWDKNRLLYNAVRLGLASPPVVDYIMVSWWSTCHFLFSSCSPERLDYSRKDQEPSVGTSCKSLCAIMPVTPRAGFPLVGPRSVRCVSSKSFVRA